MDFLHLIGDPVFATIGLINIGFGLRNFYLNEIKPRLDKKEDNI